jgi:Na+-translocating ferredoxin:NAD+ oxidoreductase RNF subunit RnfB
MTQGTKPKVYASYNANSPMRPVIFDAKLCSGCNECIEVCQIDVFLPNPVKGRPPIIVFPDECWYGGCCVEACPLSAIRLNHPLQQRARWKDKATGKQYRA